MAIIFENIVAAAKEACELPEPDVDSWQEGLQILLRDHSRAGVLSERGEQILSRRYTNALVNRMRVDDYIRRHPEVLDTPVKQPVIILGLVRTGTTLTSYLFDQDPTNRSLLRWEANNIVPPAEAGQLLTDPRCLAEKVLDEQMIKNNPEGVKTHFEPADGPTECVHLLAQDFKSMMFMAMTPTPIYADWILDCDMTSAYQHRKRVLQVLQATNPGQWVLKMPSDAVFIQNVFNTFPDAKIIWTHRDPYQAFASSFSMRANSQKIFNTKIDYDYMRCKWPLQLSLHVKRPLAVAKQRPQDFYHLYYDELVADPMAQMRKMYAWLGRELSAEAEQKMMEWLTNNPQNKFGKHEYSLDGWGFSKQDIEPYFADYLKVHPVV
jgi:hypothetical protein